MPWWAYLLAAIWYTGWWIVSLGWFMAYWKGEFPTTKVPEKLYWGDLITGMVWSTAVAVAPFFLLPTGIWKHGWEIIPRRDGDE